MERMEGRAAIISGSTRGIGEAIVRMREERLDARHPAGHIDELDYLHDISIQKMVNSYG